MLNKIQTHNHLINKAMIIYKKLFQFKNLNWNVKS